MQVSAAFAAERIWPQSAGIQAWAPVSKALVRADREAIAGSRPSTTGWQVVARLMAGSCVAPLQPTVGTCRARRRSVAVATNCWDFGRTVGIGVLSLVALALRPEFSTSARMPPTARSAPRGGRQGLLVLTAGLVGAPGPAPLLCSGGSVTTE